MHQHPHPPKDNRPHRHRLQQRPTAQNPGQNAVRSKRFKRSRHFYLRESGIQSFRFRLLAYVMAFLAGIINAGGFFAVNEYTSHVSGMLARASDKTYTGDWMAVLGALSGVVCFILGSAHSNWTILWAKRQRFKSSYGLSMWLEALYMLLFGLMGVALSKFGQSFVPITFLNLCFIMGMHNTVMTVLSKGSIRTTHMTGTATDLGIELAKVLYYRRSDNPRLPDVNVNKVKMKLLFFLIVFFLIGGLTGAWAIHRLGYRFTLPVAAVLFVIGIDSIGYDIRLRLRLWQHRQRRAAQQQKRP